MESKIKMASLLLFAVFSLSIISGVSAAQTNSTKIIPVNKTINAHENKNFTIALESNPSTGYSWIIQYNPKHFKLVGTVFIPNKNPKLDGAPGVEKFIFKPLVKGEAKIDFKYLRIWDKKHPGKEIIYHVKISK